MRWIGLIISCSLVALSGCASAHQTPGVKPTVAADQRLNNINALYARAVHEPVHPFRKPVRDDRKLARQALAEECTQWLAELPDQTTPAAFTGDGQPRRTETNRNLQDSLQGLASAASRSDTPAMRNAYQQMRQAYERMR